MRSTAGRRGVYGRPQLRRPEELAVNGRVLVGDGASAIGLSRLPGRASRPRRSAPPARPAVARRARGNVRRGGARRAALRARAGREAGGITAVAIDVRVLEASDLDAIEPIEQRAYPTPWSRSMFVSELAKPTSICLGAFEGDELVGYVINSRYVDAWHVMNVAVDPEHQRRGVATHLLRRLFERRATMSGAGTRSRCASRTRARFSCTRSSASSLAARRGYHTDNREDALIMWRDARTATE